jgi:thiol-disulfide isomerase/thioredoxin
MNRGLAHMLIACFALSSLAPIRAGYAQSRAPAVKTPAPGNPIDPAALKLMGKSRAAVLKLKTLACRIERSETIDGRTESSRGEVLFLFADVRRRPLPLKYRVTVGGDGEAKAAIWVFDGKTAAKLDHARKKLLTLTAPPAALTPDRIPLYPEWIVEAASPETMPLSARVLPETTIDGVKCSGVEYVLERIIPNEDADAPAMPAMRRDGPKEIWKATRYVGEKDLIPRQIEDEFQRMGDLPKGQAGFKKRLVKVSYMGLKLESRPKNEEFTLKPPAGYETVKATADELRPDADDQPRLKFAVGDQAPAFRLRDASGKELTREQLKGRVMLLDFWASWCGVCKKAMPSIQRLHERFQNQPVSVLGINVWEETEGAGLRYMATQGFTYPCLVNGDELAKMYGVPGIPTFVIIGRDGKIAYTGSGFSGPDQEERFARLIEDLLAKKPR